MGLCEEFHWVHFSTTYYDLKANKDVPVNSSVSIDIFLAQLLRAYFEDDENTMNQWLRKEAIRLRELHSLHKTNRRSVGLSRLLTRSALRLVVKPEYLISIGA